MSTRRAFHSCPFGWMPMYGKEYNSRGLESSSIHALSGSPSQNHCHDTFQCRHICQARQSTSTSKKNELVKQSASNHSIWLLVTITTALHKPSIRCLQNTLHVTVNPIALARSQHALAQLSNNQVGRDGVTTPRPLQPLSRWRREQRLWKTGKQISNVLD